MLKLNLILKSIYYFSYKRGSNATDAAAAAAAAAAADAAADVAALTHLPASCTCSSGKVRVYRQQNGWRPDDVLP